MEQSNKWNNAFGKQIVHELLVESYSGGVDGVISSSKGDDSRPGDRESVSFCASGFEELNVFFGAVVGVASYGSRSTTGNFTGTGTECIPDGGATAVFSRGTFNLVAEGSS